MAATIYLGADHAGFDMKNIMKEHLEAQGHVVEDLGAHTLDPHDDYPRYAAAVAKAVREHPGSFGILSCGNAEGVIIAANKFDGIRAGLGFSIDAAVTMRQDDDANVIGIPGRIATDDDPLMIIDAFLANAFTNGERHIRRLAAVKALEAEE